MMARLWAEAMARLWMLAAPCPVGSDELGTQSNCSKLNSFGSRPMRRNAACHTEQRAETGIKPVCLYLMSSNM
jgi:hypothetical protein